MEHHPPANVTIELRNDSGIPLARQISDAIRALFEAGDLSAGARLPAQRDLARDLGVDRMTVSRAYAALAASGFVVRHVGRGSFVADAARLGTDAARLRTDAARLRTDAAPPAREAQLPSTPGMHWAFSLRTAGATPGPVAALHAAAPEGAVNFSSLYPDPSLFPIDDFRRAMSAAIRQQGARLFGYGAAGGYPPLRRLLSDWLRERGVAVEDDQVLVTNGSQQGIDLVARALLEPGDRVVVENPTYTGAVQLFQSHGARVVGVPVDQEGMRPDRLEEAVSRGDVKFLYMIPNFQNPTSGTMSRKRRLALLEIAARHRIPILEDDFGGDLRYEGEEIPPLAALDRSGSVIYLSTFAKKLLPGLRIGWLAAPRDAIGRLSFLKQITDWNTSLLLQGALNEFCRRGMLARHLRRVVAIYRVRRDAMIDALRRHFPKEARWTEPQGGLVVWVTLPPGVSADEVALRSHERGVLVGRGDLFYVGGGTHNNLRLVFAQARPDEIRRGIRVLGQVLKSQMREMRERPERLAPESLPII